MQHSKFLEDIRQRGHNVDVFYDVGANIGGWSLGAQRVFPEARFELFEPLHGRLSDVDENSKIKSINRATMHPVALSDSNEEGVIKVLDNRGVGSSIIVSDSDIKNNNKIIPCIHRKLDDIVVEKSLPQPDFIKIDTQASEMKVLKGAKETIKGASFLLIETWARRVYGPGTPLFHELCSWLYEQNFVVYEILSLDQGRDEDGVLRWFDAAFINKTKSRFSAWML